MKLLFWIYCRIYWATLHKFELGQHGGVFGCVCLFCCCVFLPFFSASVFIYSYATNYIVKVKKKRRAKNKQNKNTSGNNVRNDANKCQHCENGNGMSREIEQGGMEKLLLAITKEIYRYYTAWLHNNTNTERRIPYPPKKNKGAVKPFAYVCVCVCVSVRVCGCVYEGVNSSFYIHISRLLSVCFFASEPI